MPPETHSITVTQPSDSAQTELLVKCGRCGWGRDYSVQPNGQVTSKIQDEGSDTEDILDPTTNLPVTDQYGNPLKTTIHGHKVSFVDENGNGTTMDSANLR